MTVDEALWVSQAIFDILQLDSEHVTGLLEDRLAVGTASVPQLTEQAILSLQLVTNLPQRVGNFGLIQRGYDFKRLMDAILSAGRQGVGRDDAFFVSSPPFPGCGSAPAP